MSNISFKIAPSAATSDELLSNPDRKGNACVYNLSIEMVQNVFTYFHTKGEHSVALSAERVDIPIAIPFVECPIHRHVFY